MFHVSRYIYLTLNIYFFMQKMKAESSGCDKPLGSPRQDQEFVLSNCEFETFIFLSGKRSLNLIQLLFFQISGLRCCL